MASRTRERHGMKNTPEYKAWVDMKERCYNPKNDRYKNYGARGIAVCDEWKNSFISFYSYIGEKPEPKSEYSLNRVDNNKNYEPSNIEWSTREEQANNKTTSKYLTYDGVTQTETQWAREKGTTREVIRARIDNYGWSVEKALTTPFKKSKTGPIEVDGVFNTVPEWAKLNKVKAARIHYLLGKGVDPKYAVLGIQPD